MTRAAVYCRISRDREGAGLGVERQQEDCRELAERLGWSVVEAYVDNDLSAYSGKPRPAYLRMLAAIRAGRIDAVVCWHTDRLHRSPVELEDYISACQPREVPTHTVKAGPLDLSTPSGRMVARQLGAVARYEVEHASERIRRQKERAAAAGKWYGGGRAFGYEKDGVTVRESEAKWLRDAARRLLAGESLYAISRDWRANVTTVKGGTWTETNLRRTLQNPRYAGLLVYKDAAPVVAEWPGVIPREQWEACRRLLSDPARNSYSGPRSLKWVGSGLYLCGRCGGVMRSGSNSQRGRTDRYPVYRCKDGNGHVLVSAARVDDYVSSIVVEHLRTRGADLLPRMRDHARELELRTQANALRARLGLLEDMLGDGEVSRDAYSRQTGRIKERLDAVAAELAAAEISSLAGVADADDPGDAFASQTVSRRRAIIDTIMTVTIKPSRRGRLPKGVEFDYDRIQVEWKS